MLDHSLSLHEADLMSENVVGTFSLPFSVAPNFVVDHKPALVPMVTEEPSIVAAVSRIAKMVASTGGFVTEVSAPIMKGQVQIYGLVDSDRALQTVHEHSDELLHFLNARAVAMVKRGGGVKKITERIIKPEGHAPMLLVEPLIDVRDAMGANLINTLMEALGEKLMGLLGQGHLGLRILSNFCDERMVTATASLPFRALVAEEDDSDTGRDIATRMIMAHVLAENDVYRACTHNKGILNGIDAVAIATGNDFRAIEAGAHAFAAASSRGYGPLTRFTIDDDTGCLRASLNLPLAVATVGGNTGSHRGVVVAQKILAWHARSSTRLSSLMASVGLAQCLAAVHTLSLEGIQKGHMRLHHRKSHKKGS